MRCSIGGLVIVASLAAALSCCNRSDVASEQAVAPLPAEVVATVYKDGRVVEVRQIRVEDRLAAVLRRWEEDQTDRKRSYANYAPSLLVRIDDEGYTINFAGDRVVVNRRGRQVSRTAGELDRELEQALRDALEGG